VTAIGSIDVGRDQHASNSRCRHHIGGSELDRGECIDPERHDDFIIGQAWPDVATWLSRKPRLHESQRNQTERDRDRNHGEGLQVRAASRVFLFLPPSSIPVPPTCIIADSPGAPASGCSSSRQTDRLKPPCDAIGAVVRRQNGWRHVTGQKLPSACLVAIQVVKQPAEVALDDSGLRQDLGSLVPAGSGSARLGDGEGRLPGLEPGEQRFGEPRRCPSQLSRSSRVPRPARPGDAAAKKPRQQRGGLAATGGPAPSARPLRVRSLSPRPPPPKGCAAPGSPCGHTRKRAAESAGLCAHAMVLRE
jgi:hypothetical protein